MSKKTPIDPKATLAKQWMRHAIKSSDTRELLEIHKVFKLLERASPDEVRDCYEPSQGEIAWQRRCLSECRRHLAEYHAIMLTLGSLGPSIKWFDGHFFIAVEQLSLLLADEMRDFANSFEIAAAAKTAHEFQTASQEAVKPPKWEPLPGAIPEVVSNTMHLIMELQNIATRLSEFFESGGAGDKEILGLVRRAIEGLTTDVLQRFMEEGDSRTTIKLSRILLGLYGGAE